MFSRFLWIFHYFRDREKLHEDAEDFLSQNWHRCIQHSNNACGNVSFVEKRRNKAQQMKQLDTNRDVSHPHCCRNPPASCLHVCIIFTDPVTFSYSIFVLYDFDSCLRSVAFSPEREAGHSGLCPVLTNHTNISFCNARSYKDSDGTWKSCEDPNYSTCWDGPRESHTFIPTAIDWMCTKLLGRILEWQNWKEPRNKNRVNLGRAIFQWFFFVILNDMTEHMFQLTIGLNTMTCFLPQEWFLNAQKDNGRRTKSVIFSHSVTLFQFGQPNRHSRQIPWSEKSPWHTNGCVNGKLCLLRHT